MKFYPAFVLLLLTQLSLQAQRTYDDSITARLSLRPRYYQLPDARPFGATITPEDIRYLVDTLASDAMRGRETGTEGQRKAADFIAAQFKAMGLPPVADRNTYFQYIFLKRESWADLDLSVHGTSFTSRKDYIVLPAYNADLPNFKAKEAVFVGYGIEEGKINHYADANVRGKVVVFYDGEPTDAEGRSLLTGNESRTAWTIDWTRKARLAAQKGAALALIIVPDIGEAMRINRRQLSLWGWTPTAPNAEPLHKGLVNTFFISQEVANALFGKNTDKAADVFGKAKTNAAAFKPVKIKTNVEARMVKEVRTLEGSNVIGFIEGSDPVLKNEYVVITAHYDHLGASGEVIYNGADDNASGTSSVIEIAQAFAKAKAAGVGPKRSVVCMLVSGEEKGLLGSRFYVEFPLFPLKHTVANINIDMVGRIDNRHANNPNYVYVIGSNRLSTELHEINEFANAVHTQLELDYKYNDPKDPNRFYERSDHYNFAERGIPAIFYFNGTHADYHKPSDTAEKINAEAAAKRAQLAFYTAWDLANRPSRIVVDVSK
ncbi:MAG: M28 family peptidase [Saprospiraceae bacterium]|nr:M28 family peptidase [Saprospiraceae bacterium]MDW8228819.1 M28 family peptidase [Saprospiraceae bacterium]